MWAHTLFLWEIWMVLQLLKLIGILDEKDLEVQVDQLYVFIVKSTKCTSTSRHLELVSSPVPQWHRGATGIGVDRKPLWGSFPCPGPRPRQLVRGHAEHRWCARLQLGCLCPALKTASVIKTLKHLFLSWVKFVAGPLNSPALLSTNCSALAIRYKE